MTTSNLTYAGQKKGAMFGPQHTSLIYETLLPNEIRFVRRTIADDSAFTVVLQKVNLGDASDFDVLSYAWGGREQSTPVSAAGGPTSVEIAPSLHSAMNHIWSSSPERAIWIDALCITKQNVTERTQQVSLTIKPSHRLQKCSHG